MNFDVTWSTLWQTFALGLAPLAPGDIYLEQFINKVRDISCILPDESIMVNVSGVRFRLKVDSVNKYPNTLLGSDEKDYFYDEENREYFFDRDPVLFRYIVLYYQRGKLHFPKNICASAFEDELVYFEILPDYISDCCHEEFLDEIQNIQQRTADPTLLRMLDKNSRIGFREKLRHIFDDPAYNDAAQVVYYVTGFFILVSVIANMAETLVCIPSTDSNHFVTYGERYSAVFFCVDTACVAIFTFEYFARMYAASSRWHYIKSVMALIDLCAILPYYITLFATFNSSFSGSLVTLRVFRVFRIFKFSRHSQGLRILGYTLKSCVAELGFLLFSLTLVVIIFATVIYYIEKLDKESGFYSIPASSWYTIVTMTTLGYGDMVPSSVVGKVVGSMCALCGVLVIALPVPVIVSNFSRIYQQNQRADERANRKRVQLTNLLREKKERLLWLASASGSLKKEATAECENASIS